MYFICSKKREEAIVQAVYTVCELMLYSILHIINNIHMVYNMNACMRMH